MLNTPQTIDKDTIFLHGNPSREKSQGRKEGYLLSIANFRNYRCIDEFMEEERISSLDRAMGLFVLSCWPADRAMARFAQLP